MLPCRHVTTQQESRGEQTSPCRPSLRSPCGSQEGSALLTPSPCEGPTFNPVALRVKFQHVNFGAHIPHPCLPYSLWGTSWSLFLAEPSRPGGQSVDHVLEVVWSRSYLLRHGQEKQGDTMGLQSPGASHRVKAGSCHQDQERTVRGGCPGGDGLWQKFPAPHGRRQKAWGVSKHPTCSC